MSDYLLTSMTIYQNPSDMPGCYVMRGWVAMDDGEVASSPEATIGPIEPVVLAYMRRTLAEQGRVNIGRRPDDDPVIVETWI